MRNVYRLLFLICVTQFTTIIVNAQGQRLYYQNRAITGQSEDAKGVNYLLLHKIYTASGALMADAYVMGKITAIRGAAGAWNRKWTVEVNTSTAYNTNRGSIISYNEPAALVIVTYNGENYLAVTIANSSALFNFSFTGYAQNETFTLVYDDNVTSVQAFTGLDPITIQGNVGIGTIAPADKLVIDMGATRGAVDLISDGDNTVYSDLKFSVKTTTSLAADKPRVWLTSLRKDGFFTGDVTGPTLEFYGVKKGGGYYAPLLFKSNGDLILAGANNATNGNVGIGTLDTKGYKLAVNGDAIFTKIKVELYNSWPDYVFKKDYQLPSLREVESYIRTNQHLPGIPEARKVEKEGLDVAEMNRLLLQKVEELTLYAIQQQKLIEAQDKRLQQLEHNAQ
jgi:hypothetical protein